MRVIRIQVGEIIDGKEYVVTQVMDSTVARLIPEVIERMSKNLDLLIVYEEGIEEFIKQEKGKEVR